MPELQDADLLALLNMDGSLDLLNGSLFRFKTLKNFFRAGFLSFMKGLLMLSFGFRV